jgi:hypothetical protein
VNLDDTTGIEISGMEPSLNCLAERRQDEVSHYSVKFRLFYCNIHFCVR